MVKKETTYPRNLQIKVQILPFQIMALSDQMNTTKR